MQVIFCDGADRMSDANGDPIHDGDKMKIMMAGREFEGTAKIRDGVAVFREPGGISMPLAVAVSDFEGVKT